MSVDQRIELIIKQARVWALYGKTIPFFMILSAISLYLINADVSPVVLYLSWSVFIIVCLIWWFWVIKVLLEITQMFQTVISMIREIRSNLIVVRDDIKLLENDSID